LTIFQEIEFVIEQIYKCEESKGDTVKRDLNDFEEAKRHLLKQHEKLKETVNDQAALLSAQDIEIEKLSDTVRREKDTSSKLLEQQKKYRIALALKEEENEHLKSELKIIKKKLDSLYRATSPFLLNPP